MPSRSKPHAVESQEAQGQRSPALEGGDESALAARIRTGDAGAFEGLFQRHAQPLVAYAYGQLKVVALAEEIVQDVFLRVWQRREAWDPGLSVAAYLYAAVRNGVINVQRRQRYEGLTSGDETAEGDLAGMGLPGVIDPHPLVDEALYHRDRTRALWQAVASLPPRAREAILLHWQHRLTYAEAAAVMGTSVKTVENHLGAALKTLRGRLAAWR